MALIECYECGDEISDQADACPNCGAPVESKGNVKKLREKVRGDESRQDKPHATPSAKEALIVVFRYYSEHEIKLIFHVIITLATSGLWAFWFVAQWFRVWTGLESSDEMTQYLEGDGIEDSSDDDDNSDDNSKLAFGCCLGAILLFFGIIVLGSYLGQNASNSQKVDERGKGKATEKTAEENSGDDSFHEVSEVTVFCEDFVRDRLAAPSTAEFPWGMHDRTTKLGGGKYRVDAYVDAENRFGAKLRKHFVCVLQKDGDQWRLERLDIQS